MPHLSENREITNYSMSHSSCHFLTLDANKKPTVRKGVNFQSYIPPVLPGAKVPASRASQLKKVHAAVDVKVNATMEKVSRTLPDMGPFNTIASELATEYFEALEDAMKVENDQSSKPSSYWDALEESLDKMVKTENVEDGASSASTFSLDALRGLLSRLESWNERSIRATLGTGQVLSSEVDELLEEARIISQRVELPSETLTKLRILQKVGESFATKVRSKLTLKGKEKVPLRVLLDLMKEAEALPIETEEVRFFRNQKGRIQAICHSAQKASQSKSLEKSKDVTIEAAEVRAILPDLDFLRDQVSMGEWVQKAISKTEKRGAVPIQTIEQLFEDPSAALIKPQDCEIMRVLHSALTDARAWQSKANALLSGIPTSNGKKMPSIDQLQILQEEHSQLAKICIPSLSSHLEGVVRRAKAWIKKQERTLTGTWSLTDAKNLLDEGRQLSQQVDLNPEFGSLALEVASAEQWCVRARTLISSLALSEIDQIEPLVSAAFKAQPAEPAVSDEEGPLTKRARLVSGPQFADRLQLTGRDVQGLKNYENALSDLTVTLSRVETYIVPLLHSERLPTQTALDELRQSLGMVRDLNVEDDIVQLCDGAAKWSDRAQQVLAAPFPRQAGVLRSLTTLIHDLASSPMRYHYWREIVQVAREEVWAHGLRYVTVPIAESRVDELVQSCPFAVEDGAVTPLPDLPAADKLERHIAALLNAKQEDWMRQVLGLAGREGSTSLVPSEVALLRQAQAVRVVYQRTCDDLLTPRRSPMHTRAEAEQFLSQLNEVQLIQMPSLITRVQLALNKNSAFEAASKHLEARLANDFALSKSPDASVVQEKNLFHDLLGLLEAVEFAELKVEHFDSKFTPLVSKLLQYQAGVRGLFRWDHDESVTEVGFRPNFSDLETLHDQIVTEAEHELKLSTNFIKEVAYIASAVKALELAKQWRSEFAALVAGMRGDIDAEGKVSIAGLKKHVSKWPQLAVQVPYVDILSNDDMALIDEWARSLAALTSGRAKQRRRPSLEEAEDLVKLAPSPYCLNSLDFELLAAQVEAAQELRRLSTDLIVQSFSERAHLEVPVVDSIAADAVDNTAGELGRLAREARKSPIRIGTENLIDLELKVRNANRTLLRVLSRPSVVPVEAIESFLGTVQLIAATPGDDEDENEQAPAVNLSGVSFVPSGVLMDACRAKITGTHRWKHSAAEFLVAVPEVAVVPTAITVGKRGGTVTPLAELSAESALTVALAAPPTAAGEKSLDVVLRNLDREIAPGTVPKGTHTSKPEYVYPLPLYQLPANIPPSVGVPPPQPVLVSAARSNKRGAKPAAPTAVEQENPLLQRGLTSLHKLLYQVPWTRPGMGYLSPVNEVMLGKPREWLASEKERLRERISKPGVTLQAALEILLDHKRMALFQSPEYVRARSLAASSIKVVRNCVSQFPFLVPKSVVDAESDVPIELWEKFVQPSTQGSPVDEGKGSNEVELVSYLLQLDALAFQVPTKYRLLMLMLDMYDWRVRSQSVCHHMHRDARPRPWAGDERSLSHWAVTPAPIDIFAGVAVPAQPAAGDPLGLHVIPSPPPGDFVLCAMHMSFYYVMESCRHFIRVMSDMCELCMSVTTTDQEEVFWVSCDSCEKWFHGHCAAISNTAVETFTCPTCVLASASMNVDRKRIAQNLLNSLPPRKINHIAPAQRGQFAVALLNEAKQQQIIVTLNPAEVGICKKIVTRSEPTPPQP